MRRRQGIASILGVLLGGQGRIQPYGTSDAAPEKIRLIPDEWHIHNAGRLSDGRLFFVAAQFDPLGGNLIRDFACTFLFDTDELPRADTANIVGTGERQARRVVSAL